MFKKVCLVTFGLSAHFQWRLVSFLHIQNSLPTKPSCGSFTSKFGLNFKFRGLVLFIEKEIYAISDCRFLFFCVWLVIIYHVQADCQP